MAALTDGTWTIAAARPATPAAPTTPTQLPSTPALPSAPVAITSAHLAPQQPSPQPAPAVTDPAHAALGASLAAFGAKLNGLSAAIAAPKAGDALSDSPADGRNPVLERILGDQTKLAGQGADEQAENEKQGIAAKTQAVTDLANEYSSRARYYEDAVRRAQTSNLQGKDATAIQEEVDQLTRQKNQELGDIAIQQSAASGNLSTATTLAKQVIDSKYAPIQAEIDNMTKYYQLTANDLTDSEKLQAQAKIQEAQSRADEQKQKELADYSEKIKLADPLYQAQVKETNASADTKISGEGVTLNGKPQTSVQSTAQGYADRMAEAEKSIASLGSKFTGSFAIGGSLPNQLQGADRQVYEQAKRDFVNAVLRQESGAAISASEFASAQKQYFPAAGDSAAVIAAKTANRNTAINNFYRSANVQRPVGPGDVVQGDDGKEYEVGEDGETLTPVK